jgi:hypothetical protein
MVWNNLAILLACITSIVTSSTNLNVLVYVVGFLDPSFEDPNSCTILFPSPNSNGCPSIDLGLLDCTYIFSGLNTAKGGSIPILSLCNSLACGPPCVCCCCFFFITNYVDFRCCPSNLHICLPPFVVVPQPLET